MIKSRTVPSQCEGKTRKTNSWRNITEVYPDAKVEEKHNDIEVTLPTLHEDTEIAAFGIPGNDDQKRMQMAIFGRKPTQGRDWRIRVYLIDDSTIAFKVHIMIERTQIQAVNVILKGFTALVRKNTSCRISSLAKDFSGKISGDLRRPNWQRVIVLFSYLSITESYLSLINRTFARKKNNWETDY